MSALLACSTSNSWQARVPINGRIGASCLVAALAVEPDVVDLVETGNDGVAFRLRLPGIENKDSPSVAVTQTTAFDQPSLEVSTGYKTRLVRRHDAAHHALVARAGELAVELAWACAGKRVTLGVVHPCGLGERHDFCVQAEPAE